MNEEQHTPKILEVEIVMGYLIFIGVDILELILTFTGVGVIVDDIISAIVFVPEQLYLIIRGVRWEYVAVTTLLGYIPFADVIPMRTIGWTMTVMADRSPTAQEALKTASKAMPKAGATISKAL